MIHSQAAMNISMQLPA